MNGKHKKERRRMRYAYPAYNSNYCRPDNMFNCLCHMSGGNI
ncbi:hypothetical protein CIT292_06679 [Citrobacter youngae ATCC 29220]|uniref:Uncharacterized protein n=1 Tax=Citrobacter youngae ATCC 29220 TaxID=500640 RepID=D4B644_9ENTR|nr:hypothetical protein CIT292_06679 [Citrobacter youngae ATCC 29220]